MGLTITLETENGSIISQVGDPKNILFEILPAFDDVSYYCLRFIDFYGDTTFNRLQMDAFLSEWERVKKLAKTSEELHLLAEVETLAQKCKSEPHFYLKFYGD
jgi:hypothetical protein